MRLHHVKRWLTVGLSCLGVLSASDVWAHAKSISYSNWRFDESKVQVSVRVSLLELTRLGIPLPVTGGVRDRLAREEIGLYLAEHLTAETPEGACIPQGAPRSRPTQEGWVLFRWSLSCPSDSDLTIHSRILLDQAPSHLHFARATLPPAGDAPGMRPRIVERVLSSGEPAWTLATPLSEDSLAGNTDRREAVGSSLLAYLVLGIEHILGGWDHLAFVLALVLLARSLGEVAKLVTGFTLAHSLTLGLAVLGWLRPEMGPVEAVIGFSVALIAAENSWVLSGRGLGVPTVIVLGLLAMAGLGWLDIGHVPSLTLLGLALFSASHFGLLGTVREPGIHRISLAFAFGLVHGFGFAGVLAELTLPTDRLAAALLGFNLGVELGQLAVVSLIWPVLVLLRRTAQGRAHHVFSELASASICGVGLYWFLTRTFGGS